MRPRSRVSPPLSAVVVTLALVGAAHPALGDTAKQKPMKEEPGRYEKEIRVEKIPELTVLYQTVYGNYDFHPQVFSRMMGLLRETAEPRSINAAIAATGGCIGVYPMDPDEVEATQFQWAAAIPVPAGYKLSERLAEPTLSSLAVRTSEYEVRTLPAVEAAVLDSTVAESPVDGLRMYNWLNENGYAQAAPTRMLFFNDEDIDVTKASIDRLLAGRTRIILPIKKREYFGPIELPKDPNAPARADAVRLQKEKGQKPATTLKPPR